MRCIICKQGKTRPDLTTVTVIYDDETTVVRDVPVETCEHCGRRYYDAEAVEELLRSTNHGRHLAGGRARRERKRPFRRTAKREDTSGVLIGPIGSVLYGDAGRNNVNTVDETFFAAYKQFLDTHDKCPDGPEHLRTHVWLPRNLPDCSVTFVCICGERETLPASRHAGQSIVAACRVNGIPVTENTAAEGVH